MKPKTLLQRQIVDLSKKLPKITSKHKKWAFENLFKHYVYATKTESACLSCGHTWKRKFDRKLLVDKLFNVKCPGCGRELESLPGRVRHAREDEYLAICQEFKGYQVLRYFFVKRNCKAWFKPDTFIAEAVQRWISPEGKLTTLSLDVTAMSMYYDLWRFSSGFSVKDNKHDRYQFGAYIDMYPERSFIPNIIRNGFDGNFYDIPPVDLFVNILTAPRAETLIKTGQYSLLKYYCRNPERIDVCWPSVKICTRNKYHVEDASMWLDHLGLLHYFHKDIHDPKLICPKNLTKEHNILNARRQRIEDRKRREAQRKQEAEKQRKIEEAKRTYVDRVKKYLHLCFTDGMLSIVVLKDIEDFQKEGRILKHCVYGNAYYAKKESLILSARKKNRRLATIELDLPRMEIVQCHGHNHNDSKYHKQILELMHKNLGKVKKVYLSKEKEAVPSG